MSELYIASIPFGVGVALIFSWLLFKVRFQLFEKLVQLFVPFVWCFAFLLKLLFKIAWD